MARPSVRLNGEIVRTLRESLGYSPSEFAEKSGFSDRVLRKIENESAPVETTTAICIAKLLKVDLASLRLTEVDVSHAASLARLRKGGKPRTRLEQLVSRERGAGIAKMRGSPGQSEVPKLLAHDLQDIFSAYGLHDGRRFHVEGIVDQHRGIGVAEARVLGTKSGTGVRLQLIVEVLNEDSMAITVYTRAAEHTRTLLDARRESSLVRVEIHVLVAPDAHTAVQGAAPAPAVPSTVQAEEFKGFANFVSDNTHPWAFVVDSAAVVPLPPGMA